MKENRKIRYENYKKAGNLEAMAKMEARHPEEFIEEVVEEVKSKKVK